MKLHIFRPFVCLLAAAGISCTANYMDINGNPYEPTEDQMQADGYIIGATLTALATTVVSTDVNTAQFTDVLMGGPLGGYFTTTGSFPTGTIMNFNPTDDWTNVFLASDKIIPVLYSNLRELERVTDDPITLAIAEVIKVAAMSRVTDTYGPIPYLNLSSGSINQSYDSQKEVYNRFFEELDAAISTLTTFYQGQPDTKLLADYDNVFSGNVGNWIKFSNTLRLRLALRVVYADASLAQTQAEAALSNPVGLMTSAADLAELKKPAIGTWEYPLYMIQYSFDDSRIGATIEAYMNGYNDPRRSKYFVATASGEYHGVRNGINPTAAYASSTELSRINCTNNDNLLWMTPAEAWFLRAEYELRWGSEDNARTYYEEGIRTSFSTLGVNGVDEYIADQESKPGSYTDVVNGGNSQESALASIPVCWKQGGDFETHLEQIITQKYIAMFPEGQEAWSEFRRTGYPRILTVVVNNSGGKIDTQKQIRRLNFPSTEYSTNAQAVAAATATLNSESSNPTGDNGGTNVWWDKNPRL